MLCILVSFSLSLDSVLNISFPLKTTVPMSPGGINMDVHIICVHMLARRQTSEQTYGHPHSGPHTASHDTYNTSLFPLILLS